MAKTIGSALSSKLVVLNRFRTARGIFVVISVLVIGWLSVEIFRDISRTTVFLSFKGRTGFAYVQVLPSGQEFQWSLTGAYLCADPDWPISLPEGSSSWTTPPRDDRLCSGPYGKVSRQHIPLPPDVSMAFIGPSDVAITFSKSPYRASPESFPLGTVPDNILIIKRTGRDSSRDTNCPAQQVGYPILNIGGTNTPPMEVPYETEIHLPASEGTLMPFLGYASFGQVSSTDSPEILGSGTVAVYRENGWPASNELQLVRETELFPGDQVSFADKSDCAVPSSGFLKAAESDGTPYLEVVASTQSVDAAAIVRRSTPGVARTLTNTIPIRLSDFDAIFTHPLALILGLCVTAFVFTKEAFEFLPDSPETSIDSKQANGDL